MCGNVNATLGRLLATNHVLQASQDCGQVRLLALWHDTRAGWASIHSVLYRPVDTTAALVRADRKVRDSCGASTASESEYLTLFSPMPGDPGLATEIVAFRLFIIEIR